MGLWRKLINWVKNGEKGQGDILRFFTFIIIALLIITLIIPPLFDLFSPRLTTASAIELLQNQGYLVLARDACYPGEFIPCVSGAKSLGSDTNRWKDLWLAAPTIYLGSVTISNSGTQIDIDGQLVMHGEGKVWLEIQPDLDYATIAAKGSPTQVYYGTNTGFSLPIYNPKKPNEQLLLSLDVPRVWDGITNPFVHLHAYIPEVGNNDKRFNLKLDWNAYTPYDNDILPDIPLTIIQETICVSNEAYVSYVAQFELIGGMTTCDQLDLRLRRIGATQDELVGEVVITHIGVMFLRDKLGEITP